MTETDQSNTVVGSCIIRDDGCGSNAVQKIIFLDKQGTRDALGWVVTRPQSADADLEGSKSTPFTHTIGSVRLKCQGEVPNKKSRFDIIQSSGGVAVSVTMSSTSPFRVLSFTDHSVAAQCPCQVRRFWVKYFHTPRILAV